MDLKENPENRGESNLRLLVLTNRGQAEKVESLLDAGADVNFQNKEGCTPLHLASRRNFLDIVKVLLDNGANVNFEVQYILLLLFFEAKI